MSDNSNYAAVQYGVHSVPAAAVFAGLYSILFVWFVRQSFKRPCPIFFTLTFFCAVRVASFIIRAILAGVASAGSNQGLLIGDSVLFSIGFFGLLYSSYTLVMDRELISDVPPSGGIFSRILRIRRLYRIALLVAVVLGIVGLSETNSSNPSTVSLGNDLHKASTIIFLVLVVILALQTLILALAELRYGGCKHRTGSFSTRNGISLLLVISLLLLMREAFATATIGDLTKQNNEHFWYPLVALPEILAVIIYTTPDLVPLRSKLPKPISNPEVEVLR